MHAPRLCPQIRPAAHASECWRSGAVPGDPFLKRHNKPLPKHVGISFVVAAGQPLLFPSLHVLHVATPFHACFHEAPSEFSGIYLLVSMPRIAANPWWIFPR